MIAKIVYAGIVHFMRKKKLKIMANEMVTIKASDRWNYNHLNVKYER